MNIRTIRLFSTYFLVKGVDFTYGEAMLAIECGAVELWQMDELAYCGIHLARGKERQATKLEAIYG